MSGAPSTQPFQPLRDDDPAVVGGYRLVAVLGAGGMGKVYLSYTPGGRPVALKVIRPEFSEDPEFRRRFQEEVRSAQRVQGLYTAPVVDFDTDGARPWLATAYVPGPSLAEAVSAHGALPLRSVLLLTIGAAEALQAIHAAGIVHRDLKPANVLLAPDGPRVIDFGIARAADSAALTGTGVSVGTPAFMAPEQAAAGTVTPATDVFALGQIAAFAAMGSPAYGNGPSHAVLYRIVHEDPDLGGLPAELRPLIAGCLSRDPAARPALAEVIGLTHALSPVPLRQGEDWLPRNLAGSLTAHRRLPEPAPTPAPSPSAPTAPAHTPPAVTPPAVTPTPTAYSPHVPPRGVDPYAPTGFGPASTPPPPVWAPPPAPRRRRGRGPVVAGAVAAAVAGLVVLGSLLPDGKDQDDAAPRTPTASGGTAGGKRPDPQPASYEGIDLAEDHFVMLADNPPRPSGRKGSFGSKADVYFQPRVLNVVERDEVRTGNGSLVLLKAGQRGSLETCRSETRYTKSIRLDQLGDGAQFCVLSDAGHIAAVTYRGRSGGSDPSSYITLDLTVWRNAEEPQKQP